MKLFFYVENDQKFGPYTLSELKSKRLKKTTLVWTEGLDNWVPAQSIDELEEILISEPPPLPSKIQQFDQSLTTETKKPSNNIDEKPNEPADKQSKRINNAMIAVISISVLAIFAIVFWPRSKPISYYLNPSEVKNINGIRVVKIPDKDYYISETEITIGQYLAFCRAANTHWPMWLEPGNNYNINTGIYKYYKEIGMIESNTNHPVTGISWYDAVAFANWAGGRLPTVEEWEYAAKGGENFKFAGSENIGEVAWYYKNSERKPHPVKTKKPNGYGLFDMSGNISEWTATYDFSVKRTTDHGSYRVVCGGGWESDALYCRVDLHSSAMAVDRFGYVGFRLVFRE